MGFSVQYTYETLNRAFMLELNTYFTVYEYTQKSAYESITQNILDIIIIIRAPCSANVQRLLLHVTGSINFLNHLFLLFLMITSVLFSNKMTKGTLHFAFFP
jgi:hypothetical protein